MSLLYEGFHPENHCMKKQIEQLSSLLEQNKISLLHREKNFDVGPWIEDHERFHALKAGLTQSTTYWIDSRAYNHMASSKESFSILVLSKGPSIHMGYDSQISAAGIGSVKIHHGEFKNVLYIPSLATNLLSLYQMTHTCSPKRVTFDSGSIEIT